LNNLTINQLDMKVLKIAAASFFMAATAGDGTV
jgi:hypothetical protein